MHFIDFFYDYNVNRHQTNSICSFISTCFHLYSLGFNRFVPVFLLLKIFARKQTFQQKSSLHFKLKIFFVQMKLFSSNYLLVMKGRKRVLSVTGFMSFPMIKNWWKAIGRFITHRNSLNGQFSFESMFLLQKSHCSKSILIKNLQNHLFRAKKVGRVCVAFVIERKSIERKVSINVESCRKWVGLNMKQSKKRETGKDGRKSTKSRNLFQRESIWFCQISLDEKSLLNSFSVAKFNFPYILHDVPRSAYFFGILCWKTHTTATLYAKDNCRQKKFSLLFSEPRFRTNECES